MIGLTGANGGELAKVADVAVKAPETETYMIQELHLPIYHCWCLMLEDNAAEISLNAERCRTYKIRQEQVRLLKEIPSVENLWQAVIAFQEYPFKTATGLPFRYKLKVGKNGEYNRELLIDRREKSKSLAWSSVVLAFENSKRISEEVKKPKALGDIRGVSYICLTQFIILQL